MRSTTIILMLVFAALTRAFPHPPNFAPIAAMALFGAMTFKSRWAALMFPLAAMLVSDTAIEVAYQAGISQSWGFHKGMWVIYPLMMAIGAMGLFFKEERSGLGKLGGLSLTSSLLFFTVSNFAVWAGSSMYSKDATGLLQCYVAAVPFLQWTILGDLCFTGILFGTWALAQSQFPVLRLRPIGAPATI